MSRLPEPDDVDFTVGEVVPAPGASAETARAIEDCRGRPGYRAEVEEARRILAALGVPLRQGEMGDAGPLLDQRKRPMLGPKVHADFQNLDDANRVILSSQGTLRDLERQGIELQEGLKLTLTTDDEDDDGRPLELLAEAVVRRDPDAGRWVAVVDWSALRHAEATAAGGRDNALSRSRSDKRP